MMEPFIRIAKDSEAPLAGEIRYDGAKIIWNLGIVLSATILAPLTFSFSAFFLFLILTYFTLLIGHSVGMHRMMIHRSFSAGRKTRNFLIYIGALVGMSGPFGIIKIHDIRDWAQRKSQCHDFFSHRLPYIKDLWLQLTCKFDFHAPPTLEIEPILSQDKFLIFLEKTWRLQQVPLAIAFYFIGGWSFVVWRILVRIAVSIVGHWTITYFCHNPGPGNWTVQNAAVQASNLHGLGLLTYGECWHNNHHAFPESAKIGLYPGQWDPAWWCIKLLYKCKLIYDIREPRPSCERQDLTWHDDKSVKASKTPAEPN